MVINNFNISTSDMPAAQTTRRFNVTGQLGAQFMVVVLQNPSSSSDHTKYYDFESKSFEEGHNDKNNTLIAKLDNTTYRGDIVFPSGGGDYIIKFSAINGTQLRKSRNGISTKAISKSAANPTVTFSSASTSSNYATLPTSTSTGSILDTDSFSFSWDITNNSHADYGFGLRLTGEIESISDQNFYFTTTETVNVEVPKTGENKETVSSSTTVFLSEGSSSTARAGDYIFGSGVTAGTTIVSDNGDGAQLTLSAAMSISDAEILTFVTPSSSFLVDDLTDIAVGMVITAVSGTNSYLIGTPMIKEIITDEKRVILNSEQAFANNITLTLKATGRDVINDAIGLDFEVESYPVVTPTTLTKTVRADVSSSTNVTLTDTLGLAGGNHVTYTGLNVNNSSANAITSVTQDFDGNDEDGVMVTQLAQTLTAGTVLTFTGCHKTINIAGIINVLKYPSTNRTIYLDLDQLITVGAAS